MVSSPVIDFKKGVFLETKDLMFLSIYGNG